MAKSKKSEFGVYSRRERGYRTEKPRKGFDRWGYPIICGVRCSDGTECPNPSSLGWGRCDYHQEELDRHLAGRRWREMELRGLRDLLNYEVTPAPPAPKRKRGGAKKTSPTGPVIAVDIDPTIQKGGDQ